MDYKFIFLSLVSLILIGMASGQIIEIPASQDVYVDMQANEIFNSQVLKCNTNSSSSFMNMGDEGDKEFTGWPMIQFNISNLNLGENDIAILVIKESDMRNTGQSGQVAILPLESNWNEKSSFVDVFFNLKPLLELAENFDTSKMSLDTEDDKIFAFDVSKKLIEAKGKGQNNISFTLMAVTNNSYNIDFMSRETGEGPYLLLMPYPSASKFIEGMEISSNQSINEIVMPANIIVPTTENLTEMPSNKSVLFNQTTWTQGNKTN